MDTQIAERRSTAHEPIPARIAAGLTPALFAETRQGERRFWEFFGANIRNANTRMAYVTAAYRFADWCAAQALTLAAGRALACRQLHRAAGAGLCAGHREAKSGRLAPAL